jgi:hypothetical protein
MEKTSINQTTSVLDITIKQIKKQHITKVSSENETNPELMEEAALHYFLKLDQYKESRGLIHNLENLYSSDFLEVLKSTLGSEKKFNQNDDKYQKEIQNKVNSIFYIEDHFKNYHKKTKHEPHILLDILKAEYLNFEKAYECLLKIPEGSKRSQSKYYNTKILKFLQNLTEYLKTKTHLFSEEEKIFFNSILVENILEATDVKSIFLLICACSLNIAYKNLIENKMLVDHDNEFNESANNVKIRILTWNSKCHFIITN